MQILKKQNYKRRNKFALSAILRKCLEEKPFWQKNSGKVKGER
jgi:hypothetical protein